MTSQVHVVSSSGGPVEHVSDEVSHKRKNMDGGTQTAQEAHDSGTHVLHDQEGETSLVTPEKPLQEPVAGVQISQLDKEGSISSLTPSKVEQTPSRGSNGLQSVPEGRSPIIRDKVSEDGYHWRKYGQKFVRGNEFIRSYYRCTHPTCLVKKQLECSHDGKISDIVYFGQHDHPKPRLNVPVAIGFVLSVMEEKPEKALSTAAPDKGNLALPPLESVNNSQISTVTSSEDMKGVPSESSKIRDEVCNDDPISKRQKKANRNADHSPEDRPTSETRVVVQTLSEVDIVNDGYRWRKYGQKMVKGNPNPRSYYRCSYPGCPVKKHVERASHDPKVVITSYEGQHAHHVPPSRTVTPNTVGDTTIRNGDSKLGAVSESPGPERKLKEQVDGKFRSKLRGVNDAGSHVVVSSTPNHESKPNGKRYGQPKVKEECQGAVMVANTSASISKEQENSQFKIALKENDSAFSVHTDTTNEHVSNTGNVQS